MKNSTKIPWWQPQLGKIERNYLERVFKNHFPNEGPLTTLFENKLANLLQVKYVILVPNATSAMFLSLKSLSIGHGDEVIVPDLTFIATANAVSMTGAKVVLADVDPKSVTLDPECFKKAISKKTRAVIPVHVSGRAANMTEICAIAKKNNIAVVEDAAEAFMSKHQGKYLGTFGQTGCFSLSPAKTITTGQGGFIATNDKHIYLQLKTLKDQGRPKRGTGGDDIHDSIGYNFKFTDLQAAVGLGQLAYLQKRMERLKRNNSLYKKLLLDVKEITFFERSTLEGELPLWTDAIVENRKGLYEFLQKNNVDCRRFWIPIHQQKAYKLSDKQFSVSIQMSPKLLWLPSAFTLSDKDILSVCKYIKTYYNK